MHRKALSVLMVLTAIASAASAQVHRCKDATGKVIYSDTACAGAQTGTLVQAAKSREDILEDKLRAAEAREQKASARADRAERSTTTGSSNGGVSQNRNVNITYRNDTPDKSKSSECIKAQKELEFVSSVQSDSPEVKRSRMRSATTNAHLNCR